MIKTLTLIRLRAMIGSLGAKGKDGRVKPSGKWKILGISLLFLYLGGVFAFLSASMAQILAPVTVAMDMGWLYFTLFNTAAFTMIFLFSIFETKSELFECKDNELLLSMPIKPRDIILSRIFTVLILNYAECAVVLLPAVIIYSIYGGGALALIGGLLVFLLIPPLATALSSAVGYLVSYLSSKFKNNSAFTLIFSLLFLALYFVGYTWFMGNLENMEIDTETGALALADSLNAVRIVGEASLLSPLPFVIFLTVTLVVCSVAFLWISKKYISLVTTSKKSAKVKYEAKRLMAGSAFSALAKKELGRFFSSATYILNGTMGVIFELLLSVMLLIKRDMIAEVVLLLGMELGFDLSGAFSALGLGMLVMFGVMNSISASALSLEGKSYWILKTSPVRAEDILYAKLVPHLALTLPVALVSSVLVGIATGADEYAFVFIIIAALLSNILFALFGLIMNVALPKFDFQNEAQVIKQSGAATVVILAGMGFGILVFAGAFALSLVSPILSMAAITGIILLLCVILFLVLRGPTLRKLERI